MHASLLSITSNLNVFLLGTELIIFHNARTFIKLKQA